MNATLFWLDFETTGIGTKDNVILEVALAMAPLSDPYNYRHVYHAVIKFDRDKHPQTIDPFVIDMHTKNGLWDACSLSDKTIEEVEQEMMGLFPIVVVRDEMPILAGSSIHFDHDFFDAKMPTLAKRLSHRHYDVSATKLYCQSKGMPKFPKAEAHRAKDDIEESINHLKQCDEWLKQYYKALA